MAEAIFTERLIEIVQYYPILYNTNLTDYYKEGDRRSKLWSQIAIELNIEEITNKRAGMYLDMTNDMSNILLMLTSFR